MPCIFSETNAVSGHLEENYQCVANDNIWAFKQNLDI